MATDPAVIQKGAQSLKRASELLRLVASHHHIGVRVADLVTLTGLTRPTIHRMLVALMADGLVGVSPGSKRYVLGDFCRELAAIYSDANDVRSLCRQAMQNISARTGDSTFLIIQSEQNDALCVARVSGSHPIQVGSVHIGHRQPLGVGAGGLAILAALPESERNAIEVTISGRLHAYGTLTTEGLSAMIESTRRRGYAVIGHYSVPGVIGIGLALRNSRGRPLAAITCASVDSRMHRARQQEVHALIAQEVALLQPRLDLIDSGFVYGVGADS